VNEILSTLQALLPPSKKQTSGGWTSFNAICCHHRGEGVDTRNRGGIKIEGEAWVYHCFNCDYKAGWSPGKLLSSNTKQLFKWLGLTDIDISKLTIVALKNQDPSQNFIKTLNFELQDVSLPDDTKLLKDCNSHDVKEIIDYLSNRGMSLDWYNWMYSTTPGYKDRVIIPFYQHGRIVGYTGRKIKDGKPKYLTEAQNGYVFNIDSQTYDKKYIIVVEGQFDAIAINGVAIMTNDPNDTQIARIQATNKEVICVPDRDRPGAKLINAALNNNWSVSLPLWQDHIKDVADAVKYYGRLYTLYSILHYKETNKIKIQLLKKKLESLHE